MIETCIQNYSKLYRRRVISVGFFKKLLEFLKNKLKEIEEHSLISGLIITLVAAMLSPTVRTTIIEYIKLPQTVNAINQLSVDTSNDLNVHLEEFRDLNLILNRISSSNLKIDVINSPGATIITGSGDNQNIKINNDEENKIQAPELSADNVLTENNSLLVDPSDLIGEKVIVPYIENGQEVYFFGQYDKDILWHGECLTNVYNNNKLIVSTLAQYEHGDIKSYKQMSWENDEWSYVEKTIDGDIKSGDTWVYLKTKNYEQTIDYDSPNEDDLIYPIKLDIVLKEKLSRYYHGNTSNYEYNDMTNSAYYVKFAKDGTVETLYHGNFEGGEFNDNSTHAWYITREPETNTDYMYYMGKFVGGKPYHEDGSEYYFENPLTRSTFNRVLNGRAYDCEMLWAEEHIETVSPDIE